MNFSKTLLFVLGTIALLQPTALATKFSVKNETKDNYTIFIENVGKTIEVPYEKSHTYTGTKSTFTIRVRKGDKAKGFLSIKLPKTTTQPFHFTVKYKDHNFELHFLDGRTAIIPPIEDAYDTEELDLSKETVKTPASKRKKTKKHKSEDDEDISEEEENEAPTKKNAKKKKITPSTHSWQDDIEEDDQSEEESNPFGKALSTYSAPSSAQIDKNKLKINNELPFYTIRVKNNLTTTSYPKLINVTVAPMQKSEDETGKTISQTLSIELSRASSFKKHTFKITVPERLQTAYLTSLEVTNYLSSPETFNINIKLITQTSTIIKISLPLIPKPKTLENKTTIINIEQKQGSYSWDIEVATD